MTETEPDVALAEVLASCNGLAWPVATVMGKGGEENRPPTDFRAFLGWRGSANTGVTHEADCRAGEARSRRPFEEAAAGHGRGLWARNGSHHTLEPLSASSSRAELLGGPQRDNQYESTLPTANRWQKIDSTPAATFGTVLTVLLSIHQLVIHHPLHLPPHIFTRHTLCSPRPVPGAHEGSGAESTELVRAFVQRRINTEENASK